MLIYLSKYFLLIFYSSLLNIKYSVDLKLMADKIIKTCTGNHRLYIMNTFQKICLSAAVKLRKNVIKKENRRIFDPLFHKIDFRKFHGKSSGSLLPLRTEFPYVDSIYHNTHIVPVRSCYRPCEVL